jgi:alpha-galactosidase
VIHLRGVSADVVLDESSGVPTVVYWGSSLIDADPVSVRTALERPVSAGMPDVVAPITIVPEHGSGFQGRPGLAGHRKGGTAWAARFALVRVDPVVGTAGAAGVVVRAVDTIAGLSLDTTVVVDEVLSVRCTLTNTADTIYMLDRLSLTLPIAIHATELMTFTGRWTRELHPRRTPWGAGAVLAENRRGRTSHEHVPLVFAGEPGFGEWHGDVWGAHLAWSGNHDLVAECMADGRRYVQFGELLHPGELVLEPGEQYTTPELVATFSDQGLTPASWGFHRSLRARDTHPTRPRPVMLNTWEAVYFDHDHDTLRDLATTAAELGIERFVLDDGWFGSRRDDRSGLGDWWVSPDVHPNGLGPIIDHVRGLGMEFGIWVEPEMVSPDSDLYRAHPDWALVTAGYDPVLGRQQLVLNLAHPDAYAHIRDGLHALLRDHDIAYVKWDMNRDHVQGSGADGAAGTHLQTLAVYRLLDELHQLHPDIEIESCASGGGRIDHEILRRTQRVWTSDCNDALERQTIQRGASLFIPPELIGAHIGPPRSHTTGRTQPLAFRAGTALFGHLGVEWNVLKLTDSERNDLAGVIALHRRLRPLLHGGDVVRFDPVVNGNQSSGHAYGVYAPDRSEAVVAYAQLTTGMSLSPPPLRLPGLQPDRRYRIELLALPGAGRAPARRQPAWMAEGIHLTGRQLAMHGLQLPVLNPESMVLLHLI